MTRSLNVADPHRFFQFEADFVDSLRCIPMQVRLKLDTCGIKLKLPQWHQFTPEERQALAEMSCRSEAEIQAYREFLCHLVLEHTGTPATDLPVEADPAWLDTTTVPDSVEAHTQEHRVELTLEKWAILAPLERFVLIKLSRSSHENKNFGPALREFHLV